MIHPFRSCGLARATACAFAVLVGTAGVAGAQTPVNFTLDWRFEGPAAPFTVALDKGYFKAEGLDVTIDTGNGSRESIPRVASGTYEIGFGDVNSLIRFRDENPAIDVKAVHDGLRPAALRHRRPQEPRHHRRPQEPGRQEVRRARPRTAPTPSGRSSSPSTSSTTAP